MQIEIYGVSAPPEYCYACHKLKSLLDENKIDYEWRTCIIFNDGIQYHRKVIQELADRVGQNKLVFTYPVIFVNGQRTKYLDFMDLLMLED